MTTALALESISGWLLPALAQNFVVTAAMIPLVLLLCRAFHERPAVQHLLWLLVLVKFVTPPLPGLAWTLPDIELAVASTGKNENALPRPVVESRESVDRLTSDEGAPTFATQDVPDGVSSKPRARQMAQVQLALLGLGVGWGLGSVAWAAVQFRKILRRYWMVRRGRDAVDPLAHLVHSVARTMGLKRLPTRIVPGIHSPFLCCVGRVQLAWPESLADVSEARVRVITAHEAAHLRRRDHWVAWLELAASVVWWWNPLFWLVQRRLNGAAEISCDAIALATFPEDRCVYAETLLWLSASFKCGAAPLVLAAGDGSPSSLERRLSMIVSDRVSGKLTGWGFVLAGLVAVVFLPGWSAAQAQAEKAVVEFTGKVATEARAPGVPGEPREAPGEDAKESPFVVQGRITDQSGKPLEGVEVWASCGMGSLRVTGETQTGANGRYRLPFHGGLSVGGAPLGVGTQVATISPRMKGWYETHLRRRGNLLMSEWKDKLTEDDASGYAGVVAPNQPYELNFTMAPGATVEGRLLNEFGGAISGQTIYMDGDVLPPSCGVLASAETDDKGHFRFDGVPVWLADPSLTLKLKWHFSMRVFGVRHELKSDSFEVAVPDPKAASESQRLTIDSSSENNSVRLVLQRKVVRREN